jgi:hypothetical protein
VKNGKVTTVKNWFRPVVVGAEGSKVCRLSGGGADVMPVVARDRVASNMQLGFGGRRHGDLGPASKGVTPVVVSSFNVRVDVQLGVES